MSPLFVQGRHRQRGIAAIEFALVFLAFFSLLYAFATFGAVFYTQQAVSRAAGDGARAAVLLPPVVSFNQASVQNVVLHSLSGSMIVPTAASATQSSRRTWLSDPQHTTVTVTPGCLNAGGIAGCVTVSVQYQYARNRLLPSLPLLDTSTWMPDTLVGEATVRL